MALFPQKLEAKNPGERDYYYFVSFDEEINLLMDKIFTLCRNENYLFEHEKSVPIFLLLKMDRLISEIVGKEDGIRLDEERFKQFSSNFNIDVNKMIEERMEKARRIFKEQSENT